MENEKDNFWLWIGGIIVAVVIGVFAFKSMKQETYPTGYSETRAEVEKQITEQKKK